MKRTHPILDRLIYLCLIPTAGAVIYVSESKKLIYLVCGLMLACILINEIRLWAAGRKKKRIARSIVDMLNMTSQKRLVEFPLPIIISDDRGTILWYNEAFTDTTDETTLLTFHNVCQLDKDILEQRITELKFGGKYYTAYMDCYKFGERSDLYIFYMFDTTKHHLLQREYDLSRPVVAHLIVDNYDEVFTGMKESERSTAMALIDEEIDAWAQASGGILCHGERERYLFVFEKRALTEFEKGRFDILERVRRIPTSSKLAPTLSIGVGADMKTFTKCEEAARAALDMALSRGGDQAAIKNNAGFSFYGGRSSGGERRTRVKSRVIANALSEHLKSVNRLLIMGHAYGDMDSLGAAVGMARIAKERAIDPKIVIDEATDLTGKLLQDLKNDPDHADWFITRKEATEYLGEGTAVAVVDTHRAAGTVAPELLKKCKKVFVIDHHRKGTDCIQDPQLIYQEPYASSTCEMVTELFHYMNVYSFPPIEANAMMAGIFLDTKNFTIRTNTCTFEASATLRKAGADTVAVKQYFQSDMETYRNKVRFVASAELYRKHFAIAHLNDESAGNLKIAAAQAADEMMSIENAKAAFTLYPDKNGNVAISGRSYGEVNVQLILEKFGNGGGHLTMAGALAENATLVPTEEHLKDYIDEYLEESAPVAPTGK